MRFEFAIGCWLLGALVGVSIVFCAQHGGGEGWEAGIVLGGIVSLIVLVLAILMDNDGW